MNSQPTIGRSNSRKHYHEQSMDDFMKNIKKFNLRSQRYISPKPLLYMYAKNNTTNTIDKSRSRTLSNHKSQQKSKKQKRQKNKSQAKNIRNKLQKIFKKQHNKDDSAKTDKQNPAKFIQKCGDSLKKAQKYLQGKSNVGVYLCGEFLTILNQIIEKMVNQLDKQLRQIQSKTQKQVIAKYNVKMQKLQNKLRKMDYIIKQLNIKAQNNSRLIYQLRLSNQIDIDYIFGKAILGTEQCGGQGYSKDLSYQNSSINIQQNKIQHNYQQLNQKKQQFDKRLHNLKLQLKKQMIDDKQSGRIRQAYDWQRQAYDDIQRNNKDKQILGKRLITEMEFEDTQEYYEQHKRKST